VLVRVDLDALDEGDEGSTITVGPQVAIGVRVGPAPPSLGLAAAKGRAA
jgi:hypothetical protein